MKIEFKLNSSDNKELELVDDFCKSLISNIKSDILKSANFNKIKLYEDALLNAKWINWIKKPKRINMINLIKYIVDKITYRSRKKHRYIIYIKPTIMLPGSKTPLERVARFLDKGNEVYKGTFFINKVFMKYRVNINNYWKSYVSIKLKKLSVSEVVVIK